jgi:[ribosomal protein S18]-alanine N-acetyltransferase
MSKSRRITYRSPRAGDINALMVVETTCFVSYYKEHRFSERQFRYYLKSPNTIATVATMGGEIVGYILGVIQHGQRRHSVRLYSIATVPSVRQRGIGRQLLRKFTRVAKQKGARRVTLEVAVENKIGRKLFAAEGFQQTRVMPDYYGKRHDGIRMQRPI